MAAVSQLRPFGLTSCAALVTLLTAQQQPTQQPQQQQQQPPPYTPNYMSNGTGPASGAASLPAKSRVVQAGPARILCVADVRGIVG